MRKIDTLQGPRYEMENGVLLTEEEYDAWLESIRDDEPEMMISGEWRNFKSDALAVHPDQCELAEARNKQHGVNVTYDRDDGRAIIPDRNERRKLMKVEKSHDNSGGYGDG